MCVVYVYSTPSVGWPRIPRKLPTSATECIESDHTMFPWMADGNAVDLKKFAHMTFLFKSDCQDFCSLVKKNAIEACLPIPPAWKITQPCTHKIYEIVTIRNQTSSHSLPVRGFPLGLEGSWSCECNKQFSQLMYPPVCQWWPCPVPFLGAAAGVR